jgi:transglutaminase-like putative cysteine protease
VRFPAGRDAVGLAAVAALAVLPAWAAEGVYTDVRVIPLAAGAALVAAVIPPLGSGLGRSWRWTVPASLAALLVYLTLVVAPAGGGGGADVADGLLHGWARLLTSPLPVGVGARFLVPVVTLCWTAAAGSSETLVRSRRRLGTVAPSTAALLGALVAAGGHEVAPVALGVAYMAGAAVLLWARGNRPVPEQSGRGARIVVERFGAGSSARRLPGPGVALSAAVVVSAAAVAAVAGPGLVLGRHQFDPRQHLTEQTAAVRVVSPLDLLASRLQHPDVVMFTVHAPLGQRWQQVVLEGFDGYDWSIAHAYQGGGTSVPVPRTPLSPYSTLRQDVVIGHLDGPWLPAATRPVSVEGVSFRSDPLTGSLAADSDPAPGTRYTVVSEIPEPTAADLQAASVATDAEAVADTQLPSGLPLPLAQVARVATTGATSSFTQALLIERYLRLDYHLASRAVGGHSYARLQQFLTSTRSGTSEQFATAFAVLGRVVGLPTRVVVGFSAGKAIGGDRYEVRSGDAEAWPEVDFAGIGWVPFDPTPSGNPTRVGDLPVGANGGGGQQSFVVSGSRVVPTATTLPAQVVAPPVSQPVRTGRHTAARTTTPLRTAILVAVILAVVLGAGLAAVVVAKRRRLAARRRRGDARQRIAGAWAETLERLSEAGLGDLSASTVEEVIRAGSGLGDRASALPAMYRPVTTALYDPLEIDPADAEKAWRHYDRLAADLNRSRLAYRRLAVTVDPRPLISRDRRAGRAVPVGVGSREGGA